MAPKPASLVTDIRTVSRELVRQFGLMNKTVADSDLSLSAVHALIEIGLAGELSAGQLGERLLLEKSTVSRLVQTLLRRELIEEARRPGDRRVKRLSLTRLGKRSLQGINQFAEAQVSCALERLGNDARLGVLKGLRDYSAALGAATQECSAQRISAIRFECGYTPTIIARSVEMLHSYMHRHFGFGVGFESRIATDMAAFMGRIDSANVETWRAQLGDQIVGVISIDGEDLGDGRAHLRWFAVSDRLQGNGIGSALLARALAFCDQNGFRETHLWTVKGLEAARKLYEGHGFRLADEYYGDQWGSHVLEQRFVRPLQP